MDKIKTSFKIEKYFEELFRRFMFFMFSCFITLSFFYSWSFDLFIFLSESLFQRPFDFSHEFLSHSEIQKFIFTDITEAFQTSFGISLTSTICLQIPFFIYTFWSFLVPSLILQERIILTRFIFVFLGIYILACSVFISLVFPKVWTFFLTFQLHDVVLQIQCEPRISSFSSFLWKTFLFTQVLFQIPFWFFVSIFYQYIEISFFFESRKFFYWILLSFSALTAPPDFFVQLSFSLFFLCFFEITLLSALLLQIYQSIPLRSL